MQITFDTTHDKHDSVQAVIAAAYGISATGTRNNTSEVVPHQMDIEDAIRNVSAQMASIPEPPTITGELVPMPPCSNAIATLPERLPQIPNPPADNPDMDIKGVYWDATVHSESRAKNADGTWRKRRTAKDVVKTALESVQQVIVPPTPAVPPPPTIDVPPPPVEAVTTFQQLMVYVIKATNEQRIDNHKLSAVYQAHGISSLQDCFTNTALIPFVYAAIKASESV